ncbi:MAG: hypothetical protein HXS48_07710 [Theionarchaea archaeon]|nr:MAG: hypothetical protein AYK19_13795 [Theionarchaea archaeon DG-70-1]MBU7026813.1 hypothetical protein [Theionarchaea archaeon]
MIWIILAVVLVFVIAGLVLFWKNRTKVESKEAKDVARWSIGMAIGGITGVVIGIILVEFAGYSYPFPAILWMLGMAAGQVGGVLYSKYKK